jgi:hypothetical protein
VLPIETAPTKAVNTLTKAAWIAIVLVHLAPASALVVPGALERLYGVSPRGEVGVLLTHRAALFLALIVLSAFAIVDPGARRAASVAVSISVVTFLALYARAGFPAGALRSIAVVDAIALAPLAVVLVTAWRSPPG